jgi:peptidoglycan/xylan/chitin deacetylase (PgdA/CDA1 family)
MRATSRALIATAVTATAAHAAPALSSLGPGRLLFPVVARIPGARSVALTFDDGPDHPIEQFLTLLHDAGARATFFLMGEQVARWPQAPGMIAAAGHEIAVHGYTHRGHLRRTPRDLKEDLTRARSVIEDTIGRETALFRPPYGLFSLGSWLEADRQGWLRVLWSRWGKDWEETTTSRRIADTVGQPRAGDVILLHDSDRYSAANSWRNTLGALPIVLERIAAAGLTARTVSDLLAEAAEAERSTRDVAAT